jgi:hypothetical protein
MSRRIFDIGFLISLFVLLLAFLYSLFRAVYPNPPLYPLPAPLSGVSSRVISPPLISPPSLDDLRYSWRLCRKVQNERQCKLDHDRGEFFSEALAIACGYGPSIHYRIIKTTSGREWELGLNKKNARWEQQ